MSQAVIDCMDYLHHDVLLPVKMATTSRMTAPKVSAQRLTYVLRLLGRWNSHAMSRLSICAPLSVNSAQGKGLAR